MAAVRLAAASSPDAMLSASALESASEAAVMPSWVVARSIVAPRYIALNAITTAQIASRTPRTGRNIRYSSRLLFRVRVSSMEMVSLISVVRDRTISALCR